uniref:Uncharacterized protein n=1 Tax=Oryza glumipatula TaxID=40148 RepID=A0A0D9ZVU3_9ORYZ
MASPHSLSTGASGPTPARWVSCRSSLPDHVLNESYRLSRHMARPPPPRVAVRDGCPPGIGCDRNIIRSGWTNRTPLPPPFACDAGECSGSLAAFAAACLLRSTSESPPPPPPTGVGAPKPLGDAGRLTDTGCTDRNPGDSSGGTTASPPRRGTRTSEGACIANEQTVSDLHVHVSIDHHGKLEQIKPIHGDGDSPVGASACWDGAGGAG